MKGPVAVVNPQSAGGETRRRWPVIAGLLHEYFPGVEVRESEYSGHITELLRTALEQGSTQVIAVGGDGTAHEALNAFIDPATGKNRFSQSSLALLASGTGSDFQRYFGHMRLDQQALALSEAKPRTVDYGIAEFIDHKGRPRTEAFLNIASAGLSAAIARAIEGRTAGKSSGASTYIKETLRSLWRHQARSVWLEVDDEAARRVRLDLAAIGNGRYFASGMKICPKAEVDDGHLDLLEVSICQRLRFLAALGKVFTGQHLKTAGVHYQTCQQVKLSPVDDNGPAIWLELDGEQPGRLPATLRVEPGALRLQIADPQPPKR